jgi:hypothetical protein
MNNPEFCPDRLEELLGKEISVLNNLYVCQKRMYETVLTRDWIALQKEFMLSGKMSETFQNLEEQRASLLRSCNPELDATKDFYHITTNFPEPSRTRINVLFREMKKQLLLSKTENDVLNTYVANARTVVAGMIDSVVPERRNRIYTRQGSLMPGKVESLVVNRSF